MILDGSGSSDDSTASSNCSTTGRLQIYLPEAQLRSLTLIQVRLRLLRTSVRAIHGAARGDGLSGLSSEPDFLEVSIPAAPERMDFAPIPEVALVQGRRETVQLGIFQLDPLNRWTPGDLTRASGWRSRFSTGLVDVATGAPLPATLTTARRASLAIPGSIRRRAGSHRAARRRRREQQLPRACACRPWCMATTPRRSIRSKAGGERLRDAAELRELSLTVQGRGERYRAARSLFHARSLHDAGLVTWERRFVYVLGDANGRAALVKDELSNSKFERFVIANLHLEDVSITQATASTNWPSWFNVSRITQCCETNVQNGMVNPSNRNRETRDHRVVVDGIEGHGRQGQRANYSFIWRCGPTGTSTSTTCAAWARADRAA